jgi:hypothetical protein
MLDYYARYGAHSHLKGSQKIKVILEYTEEKPKKFSAADKDFYLKAALSFLALTFIFSPFFF